MDNLFPWISLGVLLVVGAWIVIMAIRRSGGVLQFPFLATLGFIGFLGIQGAGVIRAGAVPWYAVVKFLLFSALCLVAVHIGWTHGPVRASGFQRHSAISPGTTLKIFFIVGVSLEIVGVYGMWKLSRLAGGVQPLFLEAAGYSLEWRGDPVKYAFFSSYLLPGGVLVALSGLGLRSFWRTFCSIPALVLEMGIILLLARRTPMVALVLSIGCIVFFTRRWLPPCWMLLFGGTVMVLAMFALPYYRLSLGVFSGLPAWDVPVQAMDLAYSGEGVEFRDGSYLIQVTEEENAFQYGVGFYNTWIRYFVPRAVVGDDAKEAMLINMPDAGHVGPEAGVVPNRYGWQIDPTTVPTGPASVFQQFWYASFVVYYFLARWMKGYWTKAIAGDPWAQAGYILCITPAVNSVVSDVYVVYLPVFMVIIPLLLLIHLIGMVLPKYPREAYQQA